MTAKEFVELFYNEKNELIKQYFSNSQVTEVGSKIDSLGLTENQLAKMKDVLDVVITDIMYSILLGLDGEASIGGVQQNYKLYDENRLELTNSGEIEQYAYEYFHEVER
ncbi:hypothetical protein [Litchfieldia salsa]|uniref:Uncharacterized protein n=1 Tax=Litchfieldia salsa TaxID=930152 RepID=A0A1H0SLX0_9BACI|nr:hypothetical protein [Litchfieldia salsa]SDP42710.1 hypothetical protein SAMN05216565_1036 [Litchfieldia salsa]